MRFNFYKGVFGLLLLYIIYLHEHFNHAHLLEIERSNVQLSLFYIVD